MLGAGYLFFFEAEMLTSIFAGEQTRQATEGAIPLLQLVAISMPSLALVIILNGALRGAGDTRIPLIFTVVGLVGIRIPLAYYLAWPEMTIPILNITVAGQAMGLIGAWYAMVADVVLRSLLVAGRFWQGGWRNIKV